MRHNHLAKILKALIATKIFNRKKPLFISWQITRRCNLRCTYCDYRDGSEEKELVTDNIFIIINELAKMGTVGISWTGGEPLLRDDLGKIVTYAKQKGISSKINTNGLLIPDRIDDIIDAAQVNVSFDGPAPIHDMVRGKGTLGECLKAVVALKDKKMKVVFNTTLTKYNLTAIDFILNKCDELDVGVFFQPATELYLLYRKRNPVAADKSEYDKAMELLIKEKKNGNKHICNSISGLKHLSHWPNSSSIYCSAGQIAFRINPYGQIYCCERFPGNAAKINCAGSNGSSIALDSLERLSCGQCWCAPLVELNLTMAFRADSISNAIRIGLKS